MSPVGNESSSSIQDTGEEGSYHTSRDDDALVVCSEQQNSRPNPTASDSEDDSSDPIVVSPASTPPSSPEAVDAEPSCAPAASDHPVLPAEKTAPPAQPPFYKVAIQKKASPYAVKPWAALALTLDGRDKLTKVLQYSARFLTWWLASKHSNHAQRFQSMYKSLATSRKAFRLGRSFMELEKLRNVGLVGLVFWHLQRTIEGDESFTKQRPKVIARRASSNIGWGPRTKDEEEETEISKRPTLARSLSNVAYRRMYRPLISRMSSTLAATEAPTTEFWRAAGSAVKMMGLFGFWSGDNVNFLCSSGALDDYSLPPKQRLERRKKLQSWASTRANQAYFAGSLAGLLVSIYSYVVFRREKLAKAEEELKEAVQESLHGQDRLVQQLSKLKEKQFSLFLALLKSCCDVTVFSNNPGIDLHNKWRGKKNHEGFHCLCGLISAGTVLYNNFPDAK